MLSADAEAKQCLQQKKDYIYIYMKNYAVSLTGNISGRKFTLSDAVPWLAQISCDV